MKLRIFTEPQQGASYDDLLAVARTTEDCGFDAFFRSDHYLAMGTDGLPGPTDAWVTLAALARETSRIRLGTLVTPVTFRSPGALALIVAQVDQMSGGRVELGIGAGWYAQEHAAFSLSFPGNIERFDRLEEALAVVTGSWTVPVGETFDFTGSFYPVSGSPGLPKPVQTPHPPIIVGGHGKRRTPALAATYAAEFNLGFEAPEISAPQFARVRAACTSAGRDPGDIILSNALVICCGRDDAEVAERAAAIGREPDEMRESGLCGTPAEIVDRIGIYAGLGASRIYLQVLDLADLDHLELVASEVMPQL